MEWEAKVIQSVSPSAPPSMAALHTSCQCLTEVRYQSGNLLNRKISL